MLTTRDIIQTVLLGDPELVETRLWNGMIPRNLVYHVTRRAGAVPLCLDQIWVTHASGGRSTLEFKSYDQQRKAFQGTKQHVIWLDEEPPDAGTALEGNDIYTECLLRTINTDGLILLTYTPLKGLTPFIQHYLETSVMLVHMPGEEEARLVPSMVGMWPRGMQKAKPAKETDGMREGDGR